MLYETEIKLTTQTINYKDAGVDIAAGNQAVKNIKDCVQSTFDKNVLNGLGGFASLYDLKDIVNNYKHPVMVQSIDGVGTKGMVAKMANNYKNLGYDLVSAASNDILTLGAKPITLLDYIASDKTDPKTIGIIVDSIARACKEINVSLVGGEMAAMPGTYIKDEHDLVGIVTGVVDKDKIINGSKIVSGDYVYGIASSGLHTNGYSLARKLLFDVAKYDVTTCLSELDGSIGDALLAPHINYASLILDCMDKDLAINGMSHITGGGLLENIPRVLPDNCSVEIELNSFPKPPIFALLEKIGNLPKSEAYKTFNMGIGYIVIASDKDQALWQELERHSAYKCYKIGRVVVGNKQVVLK